MLCRRLKVTTFHTLVPLAALLSDGRDILPGSFGWMLVPPWETSSPWASKREVFAAVEFMLRWKYGMSKLTYILECMLGLKLNLCSLLRKCKMEDDKSYLGRHRLFMVSLTKVC